MRKALAVILILSVAQAFGQGSRLYFNHIGIKQGLPENKINTILQDDAGYLWLATPNGLFRYDGYQYKAYYPAGESKNDVSSLCFDKWNHNLWAWCVGSGLFRYNPKLDSFEQVTAVPGNVLFFEMANADREGNIWSVISNFNANKLSLFNTTTRRFEYFGKEEKGYHFINASEIFDVFPASDGHIWIATDNGVYRYNGPDQPFDSYFTSEDTAKRTVVRFLYEPPSQPGIFWMQTSGRSRKRSLKFFSWSAIGKHIVQPMPASSGIDMDTVYINSIHEDKKQRLWLATSSGLVRFDRRDGRFVNCIAPTEFPVSRSSFLFGIKEAKNGHIFLSLTDGLLDYDPETATCHFYLTDEKSQGSLRGSGVPNKIVDNTGALWVTFSNGGVNELNKQKSAFTISDNTAEIQERHLFTAISSQGGQPKGILHNNIEIYRAALSGSRLQRIYTTPPGEYILSDVLSTSRDTLFFGTSKGLRVYDLGKRTCRLYTYGHTDSLAQFGKRIRQIYRDAGGFVWLLSYEYGVCALNPATKIFTRYHNSFGSGNRNKSDLVNLDGAGPQLVYEDSSNILWLGTDQRGLHRFDRVQNKFISYYNYPNRGIISIATILEDRQHRFWVGTGNLGLFLFDRKRGVCRAIYDKKRGLLDNAIAAIAEDAGDNIWLVSANGLGRLDAKSLALRNFFIDDISPDFELGYQEVADMLADGRIIGFKSIYHKNTFTNVSNSRFALSGKTGTTIFDPADLEDTVPPIIHVEQVMYNDTRGKENNFSQLIPYGKHLLTLPYNQNRIRFQYIGIQFNDPQAITYAYKLDGYDNHWVPAGHDRGVTYNNLSAGTYTFHVKAANASGVWSKTGDSFTLIINVPWWLRWWAWLLYFTLFAGSAYGIALFRSRSLKRENRLLEEKVSLRTHQLNEQQEEIVTQRDQLVESLKELQSTQAQLIQREKMASLGELTAGIAHEIQNPLNFVNNFSEVSRELLTELKEELAAGNTDDVLAIADDLDQNLEKINHHGNRADSIVKGMLEHSRTSSGVKELTDLNKLADEYLRLAYHGLRAKDKYFNAEMATHFDPNLPKINVSQQEIGRVFLNLFINAFYTVNQKQKTAGVDYTPVVTVTTYTENGHIVIKVKNNGIGIPDVIKDKIMQPFFTTKPTGEGTGLGLSLTYDIVVKGHGGNIQLKVLRVRVQSLLFRFL